MKLLTPREVCEVLGVSDETLRRMLDHKQLLGVRFSARSLRIYDESVRDMLQHRPGTVTASSLLRQAFEAGASDLVEPLERLALAKYARDDDAARIAARDALVVLVENYGGDAGSPVFSGFCRSVMAG